jgi:hypothetical protein
MFVERRLDARFPCHISADVKILVPEQTFTPFQFKSVIMDISERGMKLQTWEIDTNTYRKILSSSRLIRVTFQVPETEKNHTLFGKIHWLDFNNKVKIPITTYGIHFEEPNEGDKVVIHQCLLAITQDS